jgi:hypothetical protein
MFTARPRYLIAVTVGALVFVSSAMGQSVDKQCNDEWLAEKTHTTKWPDFMKQCRTRLGAQSTTTLPRAASSPSNPGKLLPVPPSTSTGTGTAKKSRPGTEHERQIQCEAEWKTDRAQLVAKTPGLVWSQFWSECDKRLKSGVTP